MVMKTVICSLLAAFALSVGASSSAHAQNVAIIDLKKVFDKHTRFQQNYELMKKEVEAAEQDVKSRQETINAQVRKLQALNPNAPEYKAMDEAVTRMKADYSILVTQHKKNFARKEATIYNAAYLEIMKEVEFFCKDKNIDLVLRFNSDLMGEKTDQPSSDPSTVAKQLNKPVVYANLRIDISNIIIERVSVPINTGRPGVKPR